MEKGTAIERLDFIGVLDPIRAVHEQITRHGIPVTFHPGFISPLSGYGADFASADLYHGHAQIFLPAGKIRAHQVFHELVHLERSYVLAVPFIKAMPACLDHHKANIQELSNDFEHVDVIAREVSVYPEAAVYWEGDFLRSIEEAQHAEVPAELVSLQRRVTLLRQWIVVSAALPRSAAVGVIRSLLIEHSLSEVADELSESFRRAGNDTQAKIVAFAGAASYPRLETLQVLQYRPAIRQFQAFPMVA
ncbi:hypothetical protein ABNQ39_35965 (plasmid) [Azospirillum sp. A26]|uniref:hypothetical protein n=1 Tax=Azospirillum sp. A26 TaxID=3160607 RepID=UPI00366F09B7